MFGLADRRARAAASWIARMGNESAAFDREAFERWRNAHPENAIAFSEAAKSWALDLPVAATSYARGSDEATDDTSETLRTKRSGRNALLAMAAVLLAVFTGVSLQQAGVFDYSKDGVVTQVAVQLSTGTGEVRAFRLSDGSIATLGANSELTIAYEKNIRRLTLLHGHARFDVAHDADRPFQVRARQSLITAYGTVFDVGVLAQGVRVTLLSGSIDVERVEGKRNTGNIRKLSPGQTIVVPLAEPRDVVGSATSVNIGDDKMLTFDNTPLAEAISKFDQQNQRKIILTDSAVLDETITGGFDATDPEGFARMLASMFGLTLSRNANGDVILAPKR